jgi:signal transduction histidine kinase/AraC-like DNA-binding protein
MLEGMKRELSFHPELEFIYKDAKDNSELQVQQINELINENIDILLVSPNEAQPLTPVVEKVFNMAIPVVVIDRKTASSLYTSFVGADNYEIGRIAGTYVANLLRGHGNIIEVIGLPGSTPAIERQRGFDKSISDFPGLHIIGQVYGNWQKQKSYNELEKLKDKLSSADLVFAHNDMMALGATELFKKLGVNKKVQFIGVDGLSGPGGGVEFVSDKLLDATLLYPTGAEETIRTALKILNKEPFDKENVLQTLIIDSSNVYLMKLQTDKINSQQKDIEKQQEILSEQKRIYNNQKTSLNIAVIAFILALILAVMIFFALKNNRKIARRLAVQNEEMLLQRNQLIEMTAKAKDATDAKLNFFTNISHEFRTPLTLIFGPLEDALSFPKLHFSVKNNLELVNRNAIRLLRLINQLMDFKKIEEGKMKLRASENNVTDFIIEITNAFQPIVNKRSIKLNVTSHVRDLKLWFDVNMLDKVLFNLLSNAIKFTNEQGYINVTVDTTENGKTAVITVEDSGIGMSPEAMQQAFDLFYQGHETNFKGSGLGLALSKELITLHKGNISVKSEKWKGSCFEITLPVGKDHLSPEETVEETATGFSSYEDMKIYTTDIESAGRKADIFPTPDNTATPPADKIHSVLLIEDNSDLRNFLKTRLTKSYEVHDAENGSTGLQLAYDIVPDLIITDIILPGAGGLHITEVLKNDIRTSHIPIILLTAKASIEEQIQGMKLKADAFIIKPFNLEYLEETINSLLKNRETLREHYTSELPTEVRSGASKKIDRKFINEFTAIIENNIGNEEFAVDDICREIGISRVQLYRKVKALIGYNVNDYILTIRMQKAKHLLLNEELSISEISFKVGFSSQAYFSTVFKSKFNMTPSDYRDSKKNG